MCGLPDNEYKNISRVQFILFIFKWPQEISDHTMTIIAQILVSLLFALKAASCPDYCACTNSGKTVHCDNSKWTYLPRDLNSNTVEQVTIAPANNIRYLSKEDFLRLPLLENISIENNKIISLNSEVFKGSGLVLRNISLPNNFIKHVSETAFKSLLSLEILDLRNNRITEIREETFADMILLTELRLCGNKLTHLSPKIFEKNSELRVLTLKENSLTTFDFVPGSLMNLVELGLVKNKLTHPPAIIQTLTSLKKLYICGNGFGNFPEDFFENLNLKEFASCCNRLTEVPVITSMSALQKIWLPQNQFESVSIFEQAGNYFPELTFLKLEECGIKSFVSDYFLEELRLNGNVLESVEIQNVEKLFLNDNLIEMMDTIKNVTELSLASNKISTIPSLDDSLKLLRLNGNNFSGNLINDIVPQTSGLEKLFITDNEITNCDGLSSVFSRLSELALCGNPLEKVPKGIPTRLKKYYCNKCNITTLNNNELPGSLEELNVGYNQIRTIHNENFKELTELKNLVLRNNEVSILEHDTFSSQFELEEINLSHNKISMIDNTFENHENLKIFNLIDNSLTVVPFVHLERVTFYGICFNSISAIPHLYFENATSLEKLMLQATGISTLTTEQIPEKVAKNLKRLKIDDNNINHLPIDLFRNLKNLVRLEIDGNYLENSFLSDTSSTFLEKLQDLDLSNSNQNRLELRDIEWTLPSIRKLKFSKNPIVCGCGLQENLIWPETIEFIGFEDVTCESERFLGRELMDLEEFDFGYCRGKSTGCLTEYI